MTSLDAFRAPTRSLTGQLRRVPLFAALPTEHRACLELLREGALFDVAVGVEVVSPGDAPALLVVTEGALTDPTRAWSTGSYLGVAECLARRSFADTVQAAAPTLLYRLDGALFAALMTRCPAIAASLRAELAAELAAPAPVPAATIARSASI